MQEHRMRRLNHRPFRWLMLLGIAVCGAGGMLASSAARDAGLVIGPGGPKTYQQMMMMAQYGQTAGGGLATFKIPDATALRSQAYQKSMEDAKAKAQRLAELAGAKLGKVVAVHENGG